MSEDISPPSSYRELNQIKDLDSTIAKILPSINQQGGDITRNLKPSSSHLRRSSSFSKFLDDRRDSASASDINIPGGFRRQFIINKKLSKNQKPPKFLTNNLIEFLNIYSNFAGEEFDDSDTESFVGSSADSAIASVDEESLLLPDNTPKPPPSNIKTYFLVFKALVGSGILFLPKAFESGGLLFSIVTLNIFGILTYICYLLLIHAKNHFGLSSFGELGFKTYGNPLRILILISILISQIGFVSTYILFTTSNLTNLFKISQLHLVIGQFVLLIPLILIRKISKLGFISLLSSICIITGLVIIFVYSINDLAVDGMGPNIVQFNSSSWSMLVGIAVTSFEGIGLILPIESAMHNPSEFPKVLGISMILITGLFLAIGSLGYITYGDEIESIILLNLPYNQIPVQMILVLYSLAVFLTAPLQLFPAIKIFENIVFNSSMFFKNGKLYNSGKYSSRIKWLKNLFRVFILSSICTLAYLNFDRIDKFVSFNGCFACVPLVYIYPPLIHFKTTKNRLYKTLDLSLAGLGMVVMIYTTYQILFD
ncbi:vacuolar amino acid transporter 4 [[Candida] jaroonii]|uniref:Vacuolar amino acid transporter 4 n=1 Tax=[Candida] jaroonii TaxID=467808 RepID=A0ACA9Y4B2_9ASCO|nr:vacuolar amino acid transporter 4 [[Candida] jaroonii]